MKILNTATLNKSLILTFLSVSLSACKVDSGGGGGGGGGGGTNYSFNVLNETGNSIDFSSWSGGNSYNSTDFSAPCSGGWCFEVGGEWIGSGVN